MKSIITFFTSTFTAKFQRIASIALVSFALLLVSVITGCSSLLDEPAVTNNGYSVENQETANNSGSASNGDSSDSEDAGGNNGTVDQSEQTELAPLTSFEEVAAYIREHGELPDNFITKKEAQALGWVAAEGNLQEVAPGMSIGGDRFGNREGLLPDKQGRKWYEADINYTGGRRNADRIVFSNDGLIYMTTDHYKSFTDITEETP